MLSNSVLGNLLTGTTFLVSLNLLSIWTPAWSTQGTPELFLTLCSWLWPPLPPLLSRAPKTENNWFMSGLRRGPCPEEQLENQCWGSPAVGERSSILFSLGTWVEWFLPVWSTLSVVRDWLSDAPFYGSKPARLPPASTDLYPLCQQKCQNKR